MQELKFTLLKLQSGGWAIVVHEGTKLLEADQFQTLEGVRTWMQQMVDKWIDGD